MSEDRRRHRLEQKLDTLEQQYDLWHEKLHRLSKARAIETDPATIFKLDKQIEEAQAEVDRLTLKITSLEEQLSSNLPPSKSIPKTNKIDESIVRSILNEKLLNLTQQQQFQVDELVQKVRTRLHNRIHSLHGKMPLWGIDHWVPLADLFVDVNILEEVSSNRRSELNDLLQDFTAHNSTDRSLDRIGLGKERQRVSGLTLLEY
jgi:Effector-associated domain 9